jgi:hypothetical protein
VKPALRSHDSLSIRVIFERIAERTPSQTAEDRPELRLQIHRDHILPLCRICWPQNRHATRSRRLRRHVAFHSAHGQIEAVRQQSDVAKRQHGFGMLPKVTTGGFPAASDVLEGHQMYRTDVALMPTHVPMRLQRCTFCSTSCRRTAIIGVSALVQKPGCQAIERLF